MPTPGDTLYDLPTVEEVAFSDVCAGIGLEGFHLTGDPSDARVAWLVSETGGRRNVLFPPGLQARFVPTLEIVSSDGVVVAREGDRVYGGCVTGRPGPDDLLVIFH
jgi:hypothetical protein